MKHKILVIDNYDSFTYNLVHIIRELGHGANMDIFRNDALDVSAVGRYDKILLSPGPGLPSEAGIMPAVIARYAPEKSIFGVCLGHQAIGEAFGSELANLDEVLHGIPLRTIVTDADEALFQGIPTTFMAGRYHSWVIHPEKLGPALRVTATDEKGQVMAVRHETYDVRGVQFHPESVLTEHGVEMLINWLKI
jgi:anthranilate synthase component 2